MSKSEGRRIPGWIASIVEQLELERKTPVSVEEIFSLSTLSPSAVREAVSELTKLGWLRPVGLRGVLPLWRPVAGVAC
jgi:predicted transcriptional regulator of viral defense system